MSISNNRSFFRDSITADWTKKDWVLNLIPLGGMASVAYEIGSACLSSRDRIAKIAEDFFKSSIQTVCRAFKLVDLNKPREESLTIDSVKDPWETIPVEVFVLHIFSYLNPHALGVSRSVSVRWNQLASNLTLWRPVIYREIAFSSKDWARWNADLVKDVDTRQEMLSLPENIVEELRRSAFPGKSIRETHVLVRMPKGLTIKKLGELAKKYFPSNIHGYRHILSASVVDLGDKSADESVWLLMTKDVLEGSKDKSYSQQKNIIAELAETTRIPYEVPTTLEAATCILAEYSRSKNRLFSNSPSTHTRCKEGADQRDFQYQITVGGFAQDGLFVGLNFNSGNPFIGVAALRKFQGCHS